MGHENTILVTGATGYVGGHLVRVLKEKGYRIRCLVRTLRTGASRLPEGVEIVQGDVVTGTGLREALAGVDAAFYLIHSLGDTRDFARLDRRGAGHFAESARAAGIRRIIYLGGLGRGDDLSVHLASRQEVGHILRTSGVLTIELRASIIIGSGSLSFEMIRELVERLPVMITPRWVRTPAQPIGINDVIDVFLQALDRPAKDSEIFEIGGPERLSYEDLMHAYARQRDLKRIMIRVPFLTPRLSSLWLGLVTPVYRRVGRALIEGIRNPTVVEDDRAMTCFSMRREGIRQAIRTTLAEEDRELSQIRWSETAAGGEDTKRYFRYKTRFIDSRSALIDCSESAAFAPLARLGGRVGWYYGNWLWRLRGLPDRWAGGVGLRRMRDDPERLKRGDVVDMWRVEAVHPPVFLRLRAEMKLPGRAWLQFEVRPEEKGVRIQQTAIFDPKGLGGRLYWYVSWPIHQILFAGMLKGIIRQITPHDKLFVRKSNCNDRAN